MVMHVIDYAMREKQLDYPPFHDLLHKIVKLLNQLSEAFLPIDPQQY